jgi:hypothetical protein
MEWNKRGIQQQKSKKIRISNLRSFGIRMSQNSIRLWRSSIKKSLRKLIMMIP